jgi:GDP-D-mannose dehydratase
MPRRASLTLGDHLYQDPHERGVRFLLHYGDMTDATNLIRIVQDTQPDEIYNLAAQSHVQVSFETAEYIANADGLGTLRLLEAIRILGMEKRVSVAQHLSMNAMKCPLIIRESIAASFPAPGEMRGAYCRPASPILDRIARMILKDEATSLNAKTLK